MQPVLHSAAKAPGWADDALRLKWVLKLVCLDLNHAVLNQAIARAYST